MTNLVIVESPTKAKTIKKFLGKGYKVTSSYGHIRDLPKSKLGVDVDGDFQLEYEIPKKAKKTVADLKKWAKDADTVFLATDEDREGEAIAWHLVEAAKIPKKKQKRIVFHEITKGAIDEAVKNPRDIDDHLVDAQQARRVLDRIVGYKLSPFLWKKIRYGLSAGRVQSVAVRLIVDREREIEKFKKDEYWTIEVELSKKKKDLFSVNLKRVDGKTIKKLDISNEKLAKEYSSDLEKAEYEVSKITRREVKRLPAPPFTTSTLQQDAARRYGFSAKQTMFVAQKLYEGINIGEQGSVGLISYMRTDSVNLSEEALKSLHGTIKKEFGAEYSLTSPRKFKTKSKSAQEAHEAIRPTFSDKTPEQLKEYLDPKQYKLYDLIWRRTIATQMKEAILDSISVEVIAKNKKEYSLRASGSTVKFDGFFKVFPKISPKEKILPDLQEKDKLDFEKVLPEQHFTKPPARYSEATLVKALEEKGIGRPSTYAPTMSTIQARGYVEKEERYLHPTETGTLVNDVLVKHFPDVVDAEFTANMEDDLDKIAQGKEEWTPIIKDFYSPFVKHIEKKDKEVSKKELTEEKTDITCSKCKKPMVVKMGRFGKFLACTGYPDCKHTEPTGEEKKFAQENAPKEKCDKCGKPMALKRGRFGPFLGCTGYPDCKGIKKIEKLTGADCPDCKKGKIVEKKSKKGRIFFACNQYPSCEFALWQKPTGETCPTCKSLLVFVKDNKVICSDKECKFAKEADKKKDKEKKKK